MIVAVDGVHDLGGMDGFGAVPIEADEPLFHERWEGRVWRMLAAVMGSTTIDRFRYTIEQMPPARVPRFELLRAMAVGDRTSGCRARDP